MGKQVRNLDQFLSVTSIHGLSYVKSDSGISAVSRIVWAVVIVMGFSTGTFIIYTSYENWGKHPILTTIETTTYPIQVIFQLNAFCVRILYFNDCSECSISHNHNMF